MPSSTETQKDLPTIFDPATCVRKGLCPVTEIRGQSANPLESHSLYYEQHGKGPEKVFCIMGLNSSCFAWAPQVRHFGKSDTHTVVVFDNRGVGNSGYPRGPYTTSGMAEDAIALLDHLGWTGNREVNVVGISLGGMIAQELAYRIPERISSLVLAVTTPGGNPWNNLPPWKGVSTLARLIVTPDVQKPALVNEMVFPIAWLEAQAEGQNAGKTNAQVQTESFLRRVATTTPQAFMGHISQMAAGLTHYCSPERLEKISKSIPKIVIVTGDDDHLVLPRNSFRLKATMPEAELIQWKGTGHGIHVQKERDFNALIERACREGKERA